MTKKRVLSLFNILVVFAMAFGGILETFSLVYALDGSADAGLTLSDEARAVGETLTVDVFVDVSSVNSPDNLLGSYTGSLSWDPLVLQYQGYSGAPPTGFTGFVNEENSGSGEIIFNGANVSGAAGSTDVISIEFLAIESGSGGLDLEFSAMAAAGTFVDLLPILTVTDRTVPVSELIPGVVELDGPVSTATSGSGSGISFAHTTGADDNRLLLIGASWNSYNDATAINSVTFTPDGGTAIALSEVITRKQDDNNRYSAIYSLLDPSQSQPGTIEIGFNASVGYGIVAGAANFSGVNQSTPLGTPLGASSDENDTTPTVTLTGLEGDELVFDNVFLGGNPPEEMAPDPSQEQLWDTAPSSSNTRGGASTEQATGDTVTMSWLAEDDSMWVVAAVPIKPVMMEPPTCYALTLSSGEHGGDPLADPLNSSGCAAGTYVEGDLIDLTASPDPGYQVSAWSGTDDDLSVELSNELTMPASAAAVSVTYEIEPIIPEVSLDGSVSSGTGDDVSSLDIPSHTTGDGENRLMLVGISINGANNESYITDVTFTPSGGSAISLTEVHTRETVSDNRWAAIYGLVDPPADTEGAVHVQLNASADGGIIVGVANFSGVNQADPFGTPEDGSASSGDPEVQFTGLAGDELIFDTLFAGGSSPPDVNVGADQTSLWEDGSGNATGAGSMEQAGSSEVTMSWTDTSGLWALVAVPINPAAAPSFHDLTVAVAPSGGGTTDPAEGVHGYLEGSSVVISATPALGYEFTGWTGDCSLVGDDCQVTMDGDKTITANFTLVEYNLDITIVGNGSVIKLPNQTTYHYGESVQLTADPDEDWAFDSWSGDLTGTDNPDTILIDGNKAVTATFVEDIMSDILVDGAVSGGTANEVSSLSFSHTTGTGDYRMMLVGVSWNSGESAVDISSVKFAFGSTELELSEVITEQVTVTGSVSGPRFAAIYSLHNPLAGQLGTITINFDAAVPNGIVAGAVNFMGVNPNNPLGTPEGENGGTDSDPSVTLTSLSGHEMVFDTVFLGGADDSYTLAVGAGQTELWNDFEGNTRGTASMEDAAGSSVTMSWLPDTQNWWAQVAVPINPAMGEDMFDLTVAVDPSGGGTTTPVVGTHSYLADAVVNLSALANTGFEFDYWDGDVLDPNSADTTITMDANKSVTAHFYTATSPISFTGEELLGRPTDDSITIKIVPDEAISYYYEYGLISGVYTGTTATVAATAGEPSTVVIDGLSANTEYFYRMQYSTDGGSSWLARDELSFHTQRAEGSAFTFDITTDNHVNIVLGDPDVWEDTLEDVADDEPDFLIDLGDTFDIRSLSEGDVTGAENSYKFQLPFFNIVSGFTPIYLIPGNHEQQEAWHLDAVPIEDSLSIIGVNAQKKYYLNPVPDGSFYTGDESTMAAIDGDNLKEDYYSWTWGDALFVVISPYWYTETKPYVSDLGGGEDDWTGSGDSWDWTLGKDQFDWLKATLESSEASYKFVLMHQLVLDGDYANQTDYGHGGANFANLYEWGGYNEDGTTWGWDTERPGWGSDPIHQVLVNNQVSAVFHGHDHQYAYEMLDGIVYQLAPAGGFDDDGFGGYVTGDGNTIMALDNPGHIRVNVSPEETCVDYIHTNETSSAYTYCIDPIDYTNYPPALDLIGNKQVNENVELAFTATATDPNLPAQTLTFGLEDGTSGDVPEGASITAGGEFSWTPTEAQGPDDYTFDVCVSDGELKDCETITVTVNEVNVKPNLDPIGDKVADEGVEISFSASAIDTDLPAQDLTFSLDAGQEGMVPVGAEITIGGAFTWTPTETQGPGDHTFDVCVTDGVLYDCETITITVSEVNTAPVLDLIGNKTIDEGTELTFTATASDSDVPDQTLSFSLANGTSGEIPAGASITTGGVFSWTPTEEQGPGDYTFDICVSDGGLSDCETITITVSEVNTAPVLDLIGNKTIDEGSELTFTATADDGDVPDQALSFSLANGTLGEIPAGASITTGGVFSWTPTEEQGPGDHTFDICVSDGGLSDCETIIVTVNEDNDPPALDLIGNKQVNENVELAFTATATDPNLPAQTLTFGLEDGASGDVPEGASITADGEFSWTPTEAQGPDDYTFDVCVSDGELKDCETITVTVNEVNVKPNLDPIGDKVTDEGVEISFSASAIDTDLPAQDLTFSLDAGQEGMVPVGAEITIGGAFSWTPTETQGPGDHTFDVCVNDGVLYDCETITITVSEVNTAPVLDLIGNKTIDEGSELTFTATASDSDEPAQTLTFSLHNGDTGAIPAGASITTGGAFSWTPTEEQGPGDYTFDICVSDGGLSDCETITITVSEVNTAPFLDPIGDQYANEEIELTFTATASDSDLPPQTLTFSLEDGASGDVPEGASITAGGEFSWTPSEAQSPGDYIFDVCVTDIALKDCETINVFVGDFNVAPVLDLIGDKEIDEELELAFTVTATDTDLPPQTLTFSLENGISGEIPSGASITADGEFSWTPTEQQGFGEYTFDVVSAMASWMIMKPSLLRSMKPMQHLTWIRSGIRALMKKQD